MWQCGIREANHTGGCYIPVVHSDDFQNITENDSSGLSVNQLQSWAGYLTAIINYTTHNNKTSIQYNKMIYSSFPS